MAILKRSSAYSGSHTTLKPIPFISEYHQMLLGCWQSVFNHASVSVEALAADLSSAASEGKLHPGSHARFLNRGPFGSLSFYSV